MTRKKIIHTLFSAFKGALPLSALLLGVTLSLPAHGAESNCDSIRNLPRPVTGIYTIGLGSRQVCSRYLSPVNYSGFEGSVSGYWDKVMPFAPHRAMMSFAGSVAVSPALLNPRGTASMQGLDFEFDWNMQAYWRLPHDLTVSVGGGIEAEAGVLTLLRNSNNPVGLNFCAAFGAAASLSWRSRISRLPILISARARTPLIGAFFMPGYGETFYEIYLGNHKDLVHAAYPGNRRKIALDLSLALDFGRTAMEVGYTLRACRANANSLVYSSVSNAFTISVIPGGLGMKKHKKEIRPF